MGEERIKETNAKYSLLASRFAQKVATTLGDKDEIYTPQLPACVRPCLDSLQFVADLPAQVRDAFIAKAKARGVPLGVFGAKGNARNFTAWEFLGAEHVKQGIASCSSTAAIVLMAYDVRIPPQFTIADTEAIADVLVVSLREAFSPTSNGKH